MKLGIRYWLWYYSENIRWFIYDHTHPYMICVCDSFLGRENRKHVVVQYMSFLRTNWKGKESLEEALFGKIDGRVLRFRTKRQARKVLMELYDYFPQVEASVGVITEWTAR